MRHLLLKRPSLGVTALVVVASLVFVAASGAARREIPIAGELAFCNGQPVAAIAGVLQLDSRCVLNLQIVWLKGMNGAYVEFSSNDGRTWDRDPVPFPVVNAGLVSGHAFPACNLPSGRYLFRAHGFKSPTEHGDLFSALFADSVSLTCP